jgi:hypothetical protein
MSLLHDGIGFARKAGEEFFNQESTPTDWQIERLLRNHFGRQSHV